MDGDSSVPKAEGQTVGEGAVNRDEAELEAAVLEVPGGEKPVNEALNWDEPVGPKGEEDDEEPSGGEPKVGNDIVVDPAVLKPNAPVPIPLLVADTPAWSEALKVEPAEVVAAAATGTEEARALPPDGDGKENKSGPEGVAVDGNEKEAELDEGT